MPSQIKVDEIKNVAGQYKIKTNVFEGQTTAGSKAVQGEGTATTNLQQGQTKWFATHRGDFSNAVEDSFNVASHTDNGTGGVIYSFTNNMGNTDYCPHVSGISGDHLISSEGDVNTTSCRFGHYNQSNILAYTGFSSHSAVGDLA